MNRQRRIDLLLQIREKLKGSTFREAADYILEYYLWHIVSVAAVTGILIYFAVFILSEKTTLVNVVLIDSAASLSDCQDLFDSFLCEHGYDPDEYCISVNQNIRFSAGEEEAYTSYYLLAAMIEAKDADIYVWSGTEFDKFAEEGILADLSGLLPEKMAAKFKDRFVCLHEDGNTASPPNAISVQKNQTTKKLGFLSDCRIGIASTSEHTEDAVALLEYLLSDEMERQ